jgi:hypothetical protein
MKRLGVSLLCGAALLAVFAPSAVAQNATTGSPPPTPAPAPSSVINNPQLRDFSLQPRQRIVTQPVPVQTQPPTVSAPRPTTAQPQQRPAQIRPAPAPAQRPVTDFRRPATPPSVATLPVQQQPATQPAPVPAPVQNTAPAPAQSAPEQPKAEPKNEPVPVNEIGGGFPWYYGVPVALFALLVFAFIRQRRRARAIHEAVVFAEEEHAAKTAEAARPTPETELGPRPWLELELKAERLSSTDAESLVQFELEITNTGPEPARNLRIDVKMFNAGEQQDQEIGAFFTTAGRESTKCNLPGIRAGQTGQIRGEVAMARDDMRAVILDNRYLFIPVIAVNALYDYGDGQTGQTSKSYVVGRELEQPEGEKSEKMGAFRVDQGPRVWRTVGQRQHKLARRV